VGLGDLTGLGLKEVGSDTVEDTGDTEREGSRVTGGIDTYWT
jgi:hypothetical protein